MVGTVSEIFLDDKRATCLICKMFSPTNHNKWMPDMVNGEM